MYERSKIGSGPELGIASQIMDLSEVTLNLLKYNNNNNNNNINSKSNNNNHHHHHHPIKGLNLDLYKFNIPPLNSLRQ